MSETLGFEGAARTTPDSWDWHWRRVRLPQRPRGFNPNVVFLRRLVGRAIGPHTRSLFEVGCAPGAWMALFARQTGLAVSGCDLAPQGVEATRRNLALQGVDARVHACDAQALARSGDAAADLVYSFGVVEHFDDLDDIVSAHAGLCRPGGRVVLTAPNLLGVSGALFRSASPTLMESHRVVTPEQLAAAARAAGLRVERVGYGGPLSAFVLLDRVESRLLRGLGYAAALAVGAVTWTAASRRLAGSVFLVARREGPA